MLQKSNARGKRDYCKKGHDTSIALQVKKAIFEKWEKEKIGLWYRTEQLENLSKWKLGHNLNRPTSI